MGLTVFHETLVRNHNSMPYKVPKERRSHAHRGGDLKPRKFLTG